MTERYKGEPSHAQMIASNIAVVIDGAEIAKHVAKQYGHEHGLNRKQKRRLRSHLTDIYIKSTHDEVSDHAAKIVETAQPTTYGDIYTENAATFLAAREQVTTQTATLTARKRMRILGRALRKTGSLTSEQRRILFEEIGYSKDEGKKLAQKVGISGALSAATGMVAANIFVGSAIAHETEHPTFHYGPITDVKTTVLVGASYAFHYGSIYLNSRSNHRLLQNPSIQTSPNIWATSGYHIVSKLNPDSEKAQRKIVHMGTFAPALIQEGILAASTLFGASYIAVARNTAGAAFNLTEAAVNKTVDTVVSWRTKRISKAA